MKWSCFDCETNILNTGEGAVGTFSGNPFSDKNRIVCWGEGRLQGGKRNVETSYDAKGMDELSDAPWFLNHAAAGNDTLVVGHHLEFDLDYCHKTWPDSFYQALPHLFIWDTQQVEYLLLGQSLMYPSLNECCEARGYPLKDDRVKEYWEQGIDTAFIPKDILLSYQIGDVENTMSVFLDQYNEVTQDPKLLSLVKIKMDDLLMTMMMSIHGMKFDLMTAAESLKGIDERAETLYTKLIEEAKPFFPEGFDYTPGSPRQVSALLFGGEVKMEVVVDTGVVFKSGARKGQAKTRKETHVFPVKGFGLPTKNIPPTKDGYSTNEEHLLTLAHPYITTLLEWRALVKDSETYYRGYSSLVWPDGMIRPSINHESTTTGRQSCSSPNLQNVSSDDD